MTQGQRADRRARVKTGAGWGSRMRAGVGPAGEAAQLKGRCDTKRGGGSKPDRRPCPSSPTAIEFAHRARSTSDPEIAFRDRVLTRVSHPNVPLPGAQPGRAAGPERAPWSRPAQVDATPSHRVRCASDPKTRPSNQDLTRNLTSRSSLLHSRLDSRTGAAPPGDPCSNCSENSSLRSSSAPPTQTPAGRAGSTIYV